jgi:hypothetical protein
MRDPAALVKLLQARLDKCQRPDNYDSLFEKLINNRPTLEPPTVKESPENLEPIQNTSQNAA